VLLGILHRRWRKDSVQNLVTAVYLPAVPFWYQLFTAPVKCNLLVHNANAQIDAIKTSFVLFYPCHVYFCFMIYKLNLRYNNLLFLDTTGFWMQDLCFLGIHSTTWAMSSPTIYFWQIKFLHSNLVHQTDTF
jgi:hypothetical protein